MPKSRTSFVVKPRLKLIRDRIHLVRHKRGRKAEGDVLLRAAILAVCANHCRTAKKDISKFLLLIPDIKPEERAILSTVESQITFQDLLLILELVVKAVSIMIPILLTSASRTPIGYDIQKNMLLFKPNYVSNQKICFP